ncbi:MAG: hypothetical protein ABSH44_00970 [Bryobacteraceae bacterium]
MIKSERYDSTRMPISASWVRQELEAEGHVIGRNGGWGVLRSLRGAFDAGVGLAMLAPLASTVAGPVIIVAVISRLTPEGQGYFYTFNSLLAFQILFDMGSAQVLLQFASHEWSLLGLDRVGKITGSQEALAKLRSLLTFAIRWASGIAAVAGIVLGLAGVAMFSHSGNSGVRWLGPWVALCAITALNMLMTPVWALLEGCNRITQVYTYRFFANVAQNGCICCALFAGGGLWAIPLGAAAMFSVSVTMLLRKHGGFLAQIRAAGHQAGISWRHELWPVQWRFALSWWSGYFLSYFFTPILFHYYGPVVAGQMGMTWSVVATIAAVSTAWISTKAARFGMLIARREYEELDRMAVRSGVACVGVAALGAVGLESVVLALHSIGSPLANRILPPLPTGLFLAGQVLMQATAVEAVYLRAHKREPFAALSATAALLVVGLSCYFGEAYGAVGAAASYCGVTLLFILPAGTAILMRCRRRWHECLQ